MSTEIRKLDRENFERYFELLSQMSEWEDRGKLEVEVKERLESDYFCEQPKYEVLIALVDGALAGFICFLQTYATFDAKPIMYIEDLFLLEQYRGHGLGKALFEGAMKIAQERGYSRIELLAFGEGPRKFYEKFGFKCEEQNHHYRKFL